MKWFTNAGARIETEPWMRPLNYWWPLVLYRHIMYTYSRKPAHLCVACARVCIRFRYIHTCAASRQVIYKYGAASPLARTYTYGSVKSMQREDTRGWPFYYQRHPPLQSFRRPHRLFQLPQSLAIFWKVRAESYALSSFERITSLSFFETLAILWLPPLFIHAVLAINSPIFYSHLAWYTHIHTTYGCRVYNIRKDKILQSCYLSLYNF